MQFRDKDKTALNVSQFQGTRKYNATVDTMNVEGTTYPLRLALWTENEDSMYDLKYSDEKARNLDYDRVVAIFNLLERGEIDAPS